MAGSEDTRRPRIAKGAARLIDKSLAAAARPALDRLDARNEARALADPTCAGIQAERARASGEHDAASPLADLAVPWRDLTTMRAIRERVAAHPWWERPLTWLGQAPASTALRSLQFAWQRAVRGWDDTATWSLDTHLCRLLADQLEHLADTSHGWPQGPDYPEFEDWQQALRANAALLRAYARGKFEFPDECATADGDLDLDRINAHHEEQYARAQEALHWVADNLGSLWD